MLLNVIIKCVHLYFVGNIDKFELIKSIQNIALGEEFVGADFETS